MTAEKKTDNLENNKEFSSRLMAVQACYQITHNKKPVRIIAQEFLERGCPVDVENQELAKPNGVLFKDILFTVDDRLIEIEEILKSHTQKKEAETAKEIEPLLRAILLCGIAELLTNHDADVALIIDDYLNITHSFYEKKPVSLVNGVLDNVAKLIR